MVELPIAESNPDCSTCQYRCLGKFAYPSVEAERDFDLLGRAYCLPSGVTLHAENAGDDRLVIISSGQIKLISILRDRIILNMQPEKPGDARNLNTRSSDFHTEVTEVTAQTVGPTFGKIVQRAEFIEFLRRHGEIGLSAARSLAEAHICFLGCSSPGFAQVCTWSPREFCSCFRTTGLSQQMEMSQSR
jgi:CRP/FNR family transcriptional regulator